MRIDVWSDIVCPFCTIGHAELEAALAAFPHADQVEVVPRSFELDPSAVPGEGAPVIDHLTGKYGITPEEAAENNRRLAERAAPLGVDFRWDLAYSTSTFDAHRVIHLGRSDGRGGDVEAALMRAYFTDGERVDDHDVIRRAAVSCGLDPARVDEVLAGDEFTDAVRADEREAQALGITGVPFFLFDGKYAVSGAQQAETFLDALGQVWEREHA